MKKTATLATLILLCFVGFAQLTTPALLKASHAITDSNVYLSWWEPGTSLWLHYDSGDFVTSIGTNAASAFDVAIRYTPNQLESFNSMALTKF